jgi:hypothetical protein
MNPVDDQLNRLFRAAAQGTPAEGSIAQARPDAVSVAPFGLETRVMAAWRGVRSTETGFWDMTLLVRGLILASLIMAVSFWPALTSSDSTSNPFAEYLQLTDSTVPPDEAP